MTKEKNVTEAIDPTVEKDAPEASLALTPSQLGLVERAAIDAQIATARAFPRDIELFKKRALSMVTFDLETAESCIYSRPVGKEKNPKTGKWEEKNAEGESIRMAEIVAACYGNLRVAARIVEQTPTYVKCEGVSHDLESNYAAKSEVVESTVTKDGSPYSARQSTVVAKAALSKAYRDAVFRTVPKSMCKFLRIAAENMMAKAAAGLTPADRFAKALKWFSKRDAELTPERVLAALQVKAPADLTEEHFTTLTGLKTAITDGDSSVAEAFPPISQKPDLSGAGATSTAKAPEVFAAGQGDQPKSAPQPPSTAEPANAPKTPLTVLRDKLAAARIDENTALNYMIANMELTDSIQTLEEAFLSYPSKIPTLLEEKNWSAFTKATKPAAKGK